MYTRATGGADEGSGVVLGYVCLIGQFMGSTAGWGTVSCFFLQPTDEAGHQCPCPLRGGLGVGVRVVGGPVDLLFLLSSFALSLCLSICLFLSLSVFFL